MPVTVQFAEAFTPYGPITASEGPLRFLTIRVSRDSGARYIDHPAAREARRGRGGRTFALALPPHNSATLPMFDTYRIEDDGVAVRRAQLGPNQSLTIPAPTPAAAAMLAVIGGAVRVDGRLHPPFSQLLVDSGEQSLHVESGDDGLDLLVLGFRARVATDLRAARGHAHWARQNIYKI